MAKLRPDSVKVDELQDPKKHKDQTTRGIISDMYAGANEAQNIAVHQHDAVIKESFESRVKKVLLQNENAKGAVAGLLKVSQEFAAAHGKIMKEAPNVDLSVLENVAKNRDAFILTAIKSLKEETKKSFSDVRDDLLNTLKSDKVDAQPQQTVPKKSR